MQTGFEATVRDTGRARVIDLRGEINGPTADAMNRAYAEAAAGDKAPVVLNFSDVDYINSTGIAVIVGILARARTDGRPVVAYGLSDHYVEIFNITHLSDFIGMYPDEATALQNTA